MRCVGLCGRPGLRDPARSASDTIYGVAPVRFDPGEPRKGPARLEVEPSIDLRDGQDVAVTVSNAYAHEYLALSLCRADGTACATGVGQQNAVPSPYGFGPADVAIGEDGTFTYRWTARADGFSEDGGRYRPFECVTPPGCVAGAQIGPGDDTDPDLTVPLTFAPDRQVRTPRLELDPPSPLRDGQSVTVQVRGFPSDLHLNLAQCGSEESGGSPACSWVPTWFDTDEDGNADVPLTMRRELVSRRRSESAPGEFTTVRSSVDCSNPGCRITVYEQGGGLYGFPGGMPPVLETAVVVTA